MSCHALLRVCTLFALLLSFFCDDAWGNALSLEEYRSSIREALLRVESEKGLLKIEERAFLEEHFPPYLDVETRSGEPVQVDNGSLLRLVNESRENAQGRGNLIAHLKALRSQISFGDKPIPLGEDRWEESRARLGKVFSAKEFQGPEETEDPPWMAFLMEILKKAAEWLQSHSSEISVYGKWMEYVFYGVILGGVVVLGLWVLRSFGPLGRRFRNLKTKPGVGGKAPQMNWQALRDESRKKGEEGAYREAIRLFFISVLMEGHERGWWVYRREATNGEHLSEVRGSSERREALGNMIHAYEKAWYGHESHGKETFSQCAEWLRLMEMAR